LINSLRMGARSIGAMIPATKCLIGALICPFCFDNNLKKRRQSPPWGLRFFKNLDRGRSGPAASFVPGHCGGWLCRAGTDGRARTPGVFDSTGRRFVQTGRRTEPRTQVLPQRLPRSRLQVLGFETRSVDAAEIHNQRGLRPSEPGPCQAAALATAAPSPSLGAENAMK